MTTVTLNIPVETFRRAYSGTSMAPERRGDRAAAGYQSTLQADIDKMTEQATKGGTLDLLPEQVERYASGYRRRVLALAHSESRIVSSWIAGPSNFPAARMNKRADIAHKRMNELDEFRRIAMKSTLRVLRPDLRPIMAGDADAIERLEAEFSKLTRIQARMIAANKAIRKYAKAGADEQVSALMAQGFSEGRARDLLKPDFCGRVGFADYETTNNGANMRRIAARIESLTRAKAAPVAEIESESGNGIRLEDDPPANRVRLFFPGKPAESVRSALKSGGFRWAPTVGAWQAYRHQHTLNLARSMVQS